MAFREIQDAYEVLKDPKEREWYDDHREQILSGDKTASNEGGGGDYTVDLMPYFSVTAFRDYDDEKEGFFRTCVRPILSIPITYHPISKFNTT